MNGAIGIDYAKADQLLESLNQKKAEMTTIIQDINDSLVPQIRKCYEGAAAESLINDLLKKANEASEAISQLVTAIGDKMKQDKDEQYARENKLANAQ